jgi:hypothetical protein
MLETHFSEMHTFQIIRSNDPVGFLRNDASMKMKFDISKSKQLNCKITIFFEYEYLYIPTGVAAYIYQINNRLKICFCSAHCCNPAKLLKFYQKIPRFLAFDN